MTRRTGKGRPPATSHARIERAAFELFEERGFAATTMDDIAAAVGVGRRTLFRYYPSKNDILWGQFDQSLHDFAETFAASDPDLSIGEAIVEAIVAFNSYDADAVVQHRQRMRLLLSTPALQAHSELRYTAWRNVVSQYVAQRLEVPSTDVRAVLMGRVALAIALTAYEAWLADEERSLESLIRTVGTSLTMWKSEEI